MKVILKNNWFVEGNRIRRSKSKDDLREIPDRLAKILPKGTIVVEGPSEGGEVVAPKQDVALDATRAFKRTLTLNDGKPTSGDATESAAYAAQDALARGVQNRK